MSYPNGILELRQLISDTTVHKRSTRKKLVGDIDGTNVEFVTYDKRIIEDSLQVYVDGQSVDFTLDDAVSGQITLKDPPDKNTRVEATYYWTWWLDTELKNFLNKGAEATGQFTDSIPDNAYLSIQAGLRMAALNFAASLSCRSLILYLNTRKHSAEFLIEQDQNDDANFSETIRTLNESADSFEKFAIFHRDDFYKRLGKRNAPSFAIKTVGSRRYGPRT